MAQHFLDRYDQDVVKNLMPLIVNVLESLDLAYTESSEFEVEVELLKEDNEQLVTQYEREKQLRKANEQRNLEIEDQYEGERKEMGVKIDSMSSIVKMFELKAKNSTDQITRLEDKEAEMKKEYSKLHDRYTDLFKTHMDYMERSKAVMGSERLEQMMSMGSARQWIAGMSLNQLNRSSGPVSYGYSELENNNQLSLSNSGEGGLQTPNVEFSSVSIKKEILSPADADGRGKRRGKMVDRAWEGGMEADEEENETEMGKTEDISKNSAFGPATPSTPSTPMTCSSHTKAEKRAGNNLYQELSFQEPDALGEIDEGADLTGGWVHPGEFASSGMGKEVENLIMENNELLATKNALNIVKDDLIAKVDELTGEHEILREEIKSLQNVRAKLQARVTELEEEIKKTKEEKEEEGKKEKSEEDEDVPMAQRKRFTRVEMARVLMERNQYKERFMELQEAVRWTEMIRASKTDPNLSATAAGTNGGQDKKGQKSIWKFFGNLFSGGGSGAGGEDQLGPYGVNMRYDGGGGSEGESVGPALTTMRNKSASVRRAAGSSRGGTDIFDGDNLRMKIFRMRCATDHEPCRHNLATLESTFGGNGGGGEEEEEISNNNLDECAEALDMVNDHDEKAKLRNNVNEVIH